MATKRQDNEEGQASILVAAMAFALFGAVGLAIDCSHMYVQFQRAQAAADAAAQAGIMSIFDGTDQFTAGKSGDTCLTAVASADNIPCYYAGLNGFKAPGDEVKWSISAAKDQLTVRIKRTVPTSFMRVLGVPSFAVAASATAAIVNVNSAVPIVVLHPSKSASFSANGGGSGSAVTIYGGPSMSIQVNSSSTTAVSVTNGGTVDLSAAGPNGKGADFGNSGGPKLFPGTLSLGTEGHYRQPNPWLDDPLKDVSINTSTLATQSSPSPWLNPSSTATSWGCPGNATCLHFFPGKYAGINVSGNYAVFEPGIYYVTSGGFNMNSGSGAGMATSTSSLPNFTNGGMLVLNSGDGKDDIINFDANAGKYRVNSSNPYLGIKLVGSDDSGTYKGILFFQDHTSHAHNGVGSYKGHSVQGGAALSLTGTIYLTNTRPTMDADLGGDPTHYQALSVQGTGTSATNVLGRSS